MKSRFTLVASLVAAASVSPALVAAETTTTTGSTTDTTTTAEPNLSASSIALSVSKKGKQSFTVMVSNASDATFSGKITFKAKRGKQVKSLNSTSVDVPTKQIAVGSFKPNSAAKKYVKATGKLTVRVCLNGQIKGGAKVKDLCKSVVIRK